MQLPGSEVPHIYRHKSEVWYPWIILLRSMWTRHACHWPCFLSSLKQYHLHTNTTQLWLSHYLRSFHEGINNSPRSAFDL
jgi:hypothetical protein